MPVVFLTNEDEDRFVRSVNGSKPDENGNIVVEFDYDPIAIDETLSQAGQAADAKAVGDAISRISEKKADKTYMVQLFEELKKLIQSGNTESAIVVLDEAILDLTRLA